VPLFRQLLDRIRAQSLWLGSWKRARSGAATSPPSRRGIRAPSASSAGSTPRVPERYCSWRTRSRSSARQSTFYSRMA